MIIERINNTREEEREITDEEVTQWAVRSSLEFIKKIQASQRQKHARYEQMKWQPPEQGNLKLNVDSVFQLGNMEPRGHC